MEYNDKYTLIQMWLNVTLKPLFFVYIQCCGDCFFLLAAYPLSSVQSSTTEVRAIQNMNDSKLDTLIELMEGKKFIVYDK